MPAHRYDKAKIVLKEIINCQYAACMNPTAGSFNITPRMQRQFVTLAVQMPSADIVRAVYFQVRASPVCTNQKQRLVCMCVHVCGGAHAHALRFSFTHTDSSLLCACLSAHLLSGYAPSQADVCQSTRELRELINMCACMYSHKQRTCTQMPTHAHTYSCVHARALVQIVEGHLSTFGGNPEKMAHKLVDASIELHRLVGACKPLPLLLPLSEWMFPKAWAAGLKGRHMPLLAQSASLGRHQPLLDAHQPGQRF